MIVSPNFAPENPPRMCGKYLLSDIASIPERALALVARLGVIWNVRLLSPVARRPKSARDLSARICARLVQAEAKEPDAWLRDDYRIARMTVGLASRGNSDPWRFAFWQYLGKTPEKLIPFFVARAQRDAAMDLPPKKPATAASAVKEKRCPSSAA